MPAPFTPTDERTDESFTELLHELTRFTLRTTIEYVSKTLKKTLSEKADVLTPYSAVLLATTGKPWSSYATRAMQVPEGLITNLPGFTQLIGDQGMFMINDVVSILNQLDTSLSALVTDTPINLTKLDASVTAHANRQDTFYAQYNTFVKANGLSHQPINRVFMSPRELTTWYHSMVVMGVLIRREDVLTWDALLTQIAGKLTQYVDDIQRDTTPAKLVQAKLFSNLAHTMASKVDILVTLSMASSMLRRSAVLLGKQITQK